MLKAIFWGNVLYGDNTQHIHRGHISVTPPIDNSFEIGWLTAFAMFGIPFIFIGIPILLAYINIQKHPNKPMRRVAKK